MLNAGEHTDAAAIAAELGKIRWSKTYYPEQAESCQALAGLLGKE
jgi:hypothetical protein